MRIPKAIVELTNQFERLPGIGPKTAQRLTFYLLHVPQSALDEFAATVSQLKRKTAQCANCQNIDATDPCSICAEARRDQSTVMVVEHPLDVLVVERTGVYHGLYHVLHGLISPLDNIGPGDLYINEFLSRLHSGTIREIILGLNPTMEGEATSLYLKNQIEQLGRAGLRLTRLGQGMPTGSDIQYADESTLKQSLEGRRIY